MSDELIRVKHYPNRRFYATHTSRYISLPEIEQLIRGGATVEIVDNQTGDDLTPTILMQLIAEKHPDKIAIIPTAMLHSMLRANEVMTEFLQAYFRNALAYLEQLQKHGSSNTFTEPMHWMKDWFRNWPIPANANRAPKSQDQAAPADDGEFAERISRLESRIAELEAERSGSK